jgi:uncharacterized protein with FMN-binding domain
MNGPQAAPMNRSVPLAALAAASLVPPVAGPLLAVAEAAGPRPHSAAVGRWVTGATYRMKWGAVTVRIRVSGKRITDVAASLPTERARSGQINNRAAPILRREVLQAQSSKNHSVSGATMTSNAYVPSLRSAITKAHL